MLENIDPKEFALAVISSTSTNGDSPEAIAEEKLNIYVASYQRATEFNETVIKANKQDAQKRFFERD